MTDIDRLGESPGRRIARLIKLVVHHRGAEAEAELVQTFGERRIRAIYGGDEPRFSELEEIASVLAVPISTFQLSQRGEFPELEIAWMEILYHAYGLDRRAREKLASDMTALVPNLSDGANVLELTRRQKDQRSRP